MSTSIRETLEIGICNPQKTQFKTHNKIQLFGNQEEKLNRIYEGKNKLNIHKMIINETSSYLSEGFNTLLHSTDMQLYSSSDLFAIQRVNVYVIYSVLSTTTSVPKCSVEVNKIYL